MKSVFDDQVVCELKARIDALSSDKKPLWGKMNAAQMLAHLNVGYDMAFTDIYKSPNAMTRWLLRTFIKKSVVGPEPYKKNTRTAPQFIIADERDFEVERQRLKQYLNKMHEMGRSAFEGRFYASFGNMTSQEWSNMYFKHINHHLTQFDV